MQKEKYDWIVEKLYGSAGMGLSDVTKRLAINRQGTFNLENTIAEKMQLGKDEKLLDVGCGTGWHLNFFHKKYSVSPFGIDISADAIAYPDVVFKRGNGDKIDYPPAFFDKVMCNYAIYYIPAWETALDEMLRVTKIGGMVVLSGPAEQNNEEIYELHTSLFGRLSEADMIALGFLENNVEPWLQSKSVQFEATTYTNILTFKTPSDFLQYYTATSLFRLTCEQVDPDLIVEKVSRVLQKRENAETFFTLAKKVRIVTALNRQPSDSARSDAFL